MKPIAINLVIKKNTWGKFFLGFVFVFAFSTLGVTLTHIYDYYSNTKVTEIYEARIKKIDNRSELKRIAAQKILSDTEEHKQLKQNWNYLTAIIKKNIFSLPRVLTEIERNKPDKVEINELIFSDNLKVVIMKGESSHVDSVSEFIVGMDRSKNFNIELSKEEINEDKKIIFEVRARWIETPND